MLQNKITIKQALDYEIRGGGIAKWISWGWLQKKISIYYANKTTRKYGRYLASIEEEKRVYDYLKNN